MPLISHATLITWGEPNQILPDQAVWIEDGRIAEFGPSNEVTARHPEAEIVDASGQLLMPGNICAHTHYYGAFSRGMAIPGRPSADFPEILEKLWWPLDQSLTLEDVRYSTLVFMVDAIRHGTTTLFDHHASPNAIEGSLDVIAEAVERSGLRSVLCYEVTDRGGPEKMEAGIRENVRFIERTRHEQVAGGRVQAMFGMHAGLTLSDETLDACRQAAPEGAGFHIHAAEHESDEYDSLMKSGLRVIDRLKVHGILGPDTIVAHGVHLDTQEINYLAETGTWLTHQPRSNMNNAVGVAPVEAMLRAGVRVGLGNDGFSNTMWEEWKTAYLVHKLWNHDPRRMPASLVAEMGAYQNAALAQRHFPGEKIGVIEVGAAADLILVDYNPPTPMNTDNLPWHIVFGFHESMITMTMVAGKILMKDRKLLTLDEGEIAGTARRLAGEVWRRYREQFS